MLFYRLAYRRTQKLTMLKNTERVNKVRTGHYITAHTDAEALPQTSTRQ